MLSRGDDMVKIRWAELRDIHDLYKVYKNDGEKHARSLTSYPIALWITGENNIFLVAEESKNNRIGFVIVRPKGDEARIDFLSVKKDKNIKAKKIREMLIGEVEDLLPKQKLTLYIPKHKSKIKMYEDLGFEEYDLLYEMYGKRKDGILMVKKPGTRVKKKITLKKGKKGVYKAKKSERSEILEQNLEKLEQELKEALESKFK